MSSKTDYKNVPIICLENVINDDLAYHLKPRKYITIKQIKEIAEKKFQCNGQGITLRHNGQFYYKKTKGSKALKHFRVKKFLFTAEDLTKQKIHLNGLKRENPQRYYLEAMKPRIIKSKRNNVHIDTTDLTH
jgi:hypothetical protein